MEIYGIYLENPNFIRKGDAILRKKTSILISFSVAYDFQVEKMQKIWRIK